MSAPLFLPGDKHPFSAAETRTIPHREAPSRAWAYSLAQHVEARTVAPGQVAALSIVGFLICFALGRVLGVGGLP